MKLEELGKEISKVFVIDHTLKIYCYEHKINFIDYTPEYELPNGDIIRASYGQFLTLGLRKNKISFIENSSLGLITNSNKDMIVYLTNLIGKEIEDYNQIPKLQSFDTLECIDIKCE